ncbi:MAG: DUF2283 domain-containing protein [Chloroflexota bacterium]
MKIRYFSDTDTLYVVFNDRPIVETSDLNANTLVDLDAEGNVVALTVEHARDLVDLSDISLKDLTFPAPAAAD